MPAAVVVYDPDGILPPSFASDAGLRDVIARVEQPADANRLARDAAVVVLVAGRDSSAMLGFLASSGGRRTPRLVLFASNARHHRRVVIRAVRHEAIALIGQSPAALAECIRELVAPHGLADERGHGAAAAPSSIQALTLVTG
jgi:hypothetical protein